MLDLTFTVEGVEAIPFAAAPQLVFKLRIHNATPLQIHAILLRCQIRIEPARRHYTPAEQVKLLDLFGDPKRWSQTVRSMLWTHCSVMVPGFIGEVLVDLPVPCTFDFTVATTKYFHALADGLVPLSLLFSGTLFFESEEAGLQTVQVPWDKEAIFAMPVRVWQEMMDLYYPNSAWLNLRRDLFDRLLQFKVDHGIPTWEQTVERLLLAAEQPRP